MVLKRIQKIAIFILIICIISLCCNLCLTLIWDRNIEFQYRNLTSSDYYNAINLLESSYTTPNPKTKEEYRNFIECDLGIKFYIYTEKDMVGYAGKTYPLARLIIIDTDADGYKYCITFVHEAIHLKEFIGQEDYVSFQTFKYLYESEELHNVGVWYGLSQVYGCYSGEYNVSHLIVNYLTNK